MSAKEKLQALTTAWYGFALFVGIADIVMNGLGVLSIGLATVATVFGVFVTWVLGRLLVGKSSVMRVVLVVLSAIGVVAGVVGAGASLLNVFSGQALREIVMAVIGIASASMNVRSFRVLTDRSVKAYFA